MKRFALLLLLALDCCGSAWADSGMLMAGVANRQMPLDALTAPSACKSFRRLKTSYTANKAANVVRASDSAAIDIGFLASGAPDVGTLTTFLNATTGAIATWYDQCGASDEVQATAGNRLAALLSFTGIATSTRSTSSSQNVLTAGNVTPATGVVTFSAVANRTAGTGACIYIRENGTTGNRLTTTSAAANSVTLAGGSSGSFAATASDAAVHALIGVMNGASSLVSVDGTETTGTATGSTTAGTAGTVGGTSTSCNVGETIYWDNVVLAADQRTYLISGQRIGFGF